MNASRTGPVQPVKPRQRLRITDQESARVVALCNPEGTIAGAGCLISGRCVLTCLHVADRAVNGGSATKGSLISVKLMGIDGQPCVTAHVVKIGARAPYSQDIALLELDEDLDLSNGPAEFAAPMRHAGKSFSVLGFPGGDAQGRTATGFLHASDTTGLVQMDAGSPVLIQGGFSGAPVWCRELGAFVGIVVAATEGKGDVAWCIPSRLLCGFHEDLTVRFRIPEADRPVINDYEVDDPNLQLFGTESDREDRLLTARVSERRRYYVVKAKYQCLSPGKPGRGGYVTFITYPDFRHDEEDAYELFAPLVNGVAETEFYPSELFTMAAIGDGGDTALTLDLERLPLDRAGSKIGRKRKSGGRSR